MPPPAKTNWKSPGFISAGQYFNGLLGIMLTMTTYGTWLRGDRRGWIDDGVLMPPDPDLESADQQRMKHPVYLFSPGYIQEVGHHLGHGLIDRHDVGIWALTVQSWHVHVMVGATTTPIPDLVKTAKEKVRRGLGERRPIWTDGYDKRFCFDEASLRTRIEYVERHNAREKLPAKPWEFITSPWDELKSPPLRTTWG